MGHGDGFLAQAIPQGQEDRDHRRGDGSFRRGDGSFVLTRFEWLAEKWKRRGSLVEDVLDTVIDRIVKTVNPDKIILFGSRSRRQDGPFSDYDLMVLKRGINNRRALAH